jgi:hypothetical protein
MTSSPIIPDRPPRHHNVAFHPAKRSFAYGIDRYLGGTKLEVSLVADDLTEDEAIWMCNLLNLPSTHPDDL